MKPKTVQAKGTEKTSGHRKWPPEVRLQMAQAVVDRGASAATVAQAFGIPVTTVVDWSRRYRKHGRDPRTWWDGEGKRRKEGHERKADARRAAVVQTRQAHPEQGTRRIRDVMRRQPIAERYDLLVPETTIGRHRLAQHN